MENKSFLTDLSDIEYILKEMTIKQKVPAKSTLKNFTYSLLNEILTNKYDEKINPKYLNLSDNYIKYKTWLLKLISFILTNKISLKVELKYLKQQSQYYQFNLIAFGTHYIIPSILKVGITLDFNITMSLRSGNLIVHCIKSKLMYQNGNEIFNNALNINKFLNVKDNDECEWLFFNNNLGKDGRCMCICDRKDCYYCTNKNDIEPFEEMRTHINGQCASDDYNTKSYSYTQAWTFSNKRNSLDNNCNYKCSFCREQKGKLMRIFFHREKDADHSCYFFMCDACVDDYRNADGDKVELCPNCGKFWVNFTKINYIKFRI